MGNYNRLMAKTGSAKSEVTSRAAVPAKTRGRATATTADGKRSLDDSRVAAALLEFIALAVERSRVR